MATKDESLIAAMEAGDVLVEAERRYKIIAKVMDPDRELGENERPLTGTEIKALSIEADRLMHKIVGLRAEKAADAKKSSGGEKPGANPALGKVVEFNADRFRKSG